ncbi:S1 family peptidase [Streptomyces sp. N1]|uniref:S1 family peptidase n=1 Tax=Streptomyces sp. N1 TaxID=576456 RepID=UPI0019D6B72F|nr:S1 family peptidase [Streptomyces sp. N1]
MNTPQPHHRAEATSAGRRPGRLTTLLGATVAIACLAGIATASQPAATTRTDRALTADADAYAPPEPASFQNGAARMPAALKTAVRRDLGLAPAQYLAAADAARTASRTATRLGDGITASWLDQDLRLHVTATTRHAAEAAQAAGAEVHRKDPLAAEAQRRNATDDKNTYWVDRIRNKVSSYTASSMQIMKKKTTDTLAGGYGYVFATDQGKARCSLGFFGTGAFGQPLNFTAGHCVEPALPTSDIELLDLDTPTSNGGTPKITGTMGTPGSGNIGLGDDGGIINITDPARTTATVSTWGGGQGSQSDGPRVPVHDSTGVITGMPVCKSGSTTGWTCGRVTVTETTEVIGDGAGGIAGEVTGFLFDACILSGDSGGAILSGNYAVGVDSFGNMRTCADAGTEGKLAGGFALTAGTRNAETMFGDHFNLDIHVGAPTITGVTTVRPSPSHKPHRVLSGTVDAAAGAIVRVRVGLTHDMTTTVQEGGIWSLPLPTFTRPGINIVTATASHTPNGSDLTTTGKTTRATVIVPIH